MSIPRSFEEVCRRECMGIPDKVIAVFGKIEQETKGKSIMCTQNAEHWGVRYSNKRQDCEFSLCFTRYPHLRMVILSVELHTPAALTTSIETDAVKVTLSIARIREIRNLFDTVLKVMTEEDSLHKARPEDDLAMDVE